MDAKNFTQEDVNEGRLLYEHRRPFSNLTAFDVISLEALADYAQRSLDLVLNIRISVTAMIPGGGIDRYIGTEGVTVQEGGVALIRTRNLNTSGILAFIRRHRQQGVAVERYSYEHDKHQPPLLRLRVSLFESTRVIFSGTKVWPFSLFQVSSLPKHGNLLISKEKAILGQLFTQLDIDRGFVSYVHDHSDSIFDTFGVAIFLEGKSDGRGRQAGIYVELFRR